MLLTGHGNQYGIDVPGPPQALSRPDGPRPAGPQPLPDELTMQAVGLDDQHVSHRGLAG